jgi:hypothetical protein
VFRARPEPSQLPRDESRRSPGRGDATPAVEGSPFDDKPPDRQNSRSAGIRRLAVSPAIRQLAVRYEQPGLYLGLEQARQKRTGRTSSACYNDVLSRIAATTPSTREHECVAMRLPAAPRRMDITDEMHVPELRPGAPPALHTIGEYPFQELCRDLFNMEAEIATCEIYGTRGQAQMASICSRSGATAMGSRWGTASATLTFHPRRFARRGRSFSATGRAGRAKTSTLNPVHGLRYEQPSASGRDRRPEAALRRVRDRLRGLVRRRDRQPAATASRYCRQLFPPAKYLV